MTKIKPADRAAIDATYPNPPGALTQVNVYQSGNPGYIPPAESPSPTAPDRLPLLGLGVVIAAIAAMGMWMFRPNAQLQGLKAENAQLQAQQATTKAQLEAVKGVVCR